MHPSHLLPKPHICISACAETAEDDEHEAQGDDEAAAPGGSQAAGQRVRIKRERQEREARQQQQPDLQTGRKAVFHDGFPGGTR